MSRFRVLCAATLLFCASGTVLADAASHAAKTEKFLELIQANKLTTPIYMQVRDMFVQSFDEARAPASKRPLLESYQARANAALDRAIGWDKLQPGVLKLYTDAFSESEISQLTDFYRSPLGRKVMARMPALTMQSAQLAQRELGRAVPEVNQLLDDMQKELKGKTK